MYLSRDPADPPSGNSARFATVALRAFAGPAVHTGGRAVNYSKCTEAELVELVQKTGDPAAYPELVARHWPLLVPRFGGDADAEDAAQCAVLKAWLWLTVGPGK